MPPFDHRKAGAGRIDPRQAGFGTAVSSGAVIVYPPGLSVIVTVNNPTVTVPGDVVVSATPLSIVVTVQHPDVVSEVTVDVEPLVVLALLGHPSVLLADVVVDVPGLTAQIVVNHPNVVIGKTEILYLKRVYEYPDVLITEESYPA